MTPALFGKIPSEGDFLRFNIVSAESRKFASWVEAAQISWQEHGARLQQGDDGIVLFLHHDEGAELASVGLLRASVDRVGREFPLAVFCSVQARLLAQTCAGVPWAFADFFDGAATLLASANQSDRAQLESRLIELTVPTQEALRLSAQRCVELADSTDASAHDASIFGGFIERAYAYKTITMACDQARKAGSGSAIVVQCPVSGDAHLALWLEFTRRLLRRGPFSFFARPVVPSTGGVVSSPELGAAVPQLPSSLLVGLGTAPAGALSFLAGFGLNYSKLWPLVSSSPRALESMVASLSAAQRDALEKPGRSVSDVFKAFGA